MVSDLLPLGATKLHLRGHRIQLRNSRPALPRFLLPATSKFPRIRPESQACGRETPTYTTGKEAIQLAVCG